MILCLLWSGLDKDGVFDKFAQLVFANGKCAYSEVFPGIAERKADRLALLAGPRGGYLRIGAHGRRVYLRCCDARGPVPRGIREGQRFPTARPESGGTGWRCEGVG